MFCLVWVYIGLLVMFLLFSMMLLVLVLISLIIM